MSDWLVRASDLLAEPDPGPTPMLVDGLIVDRSLAAIVGRWKHGKTWGLLELGVAVATGEPAFGTRHVAEPGPVILVLEESGRAALHRRLDALSRGRAIEPGRLTHLYAAANQRVRLDDPDWAARLTHAANELHARAVFLDPIARLRRAGLDENSQREYAVVIEAMRDIRDQTSAAVIWVAHTGHTGETMRGSSDLESVWESRLAFKRDGDTITVTSEHREAEPSDPLVLRLAWHADARTMRLDEIAQPGRLPAVRDQILAYLEQHPGASGKDIESAVEGRGVLIRRILGQLTEGGTTIRASSSKRDAQGRPRHFEGYFLNSHAPSLLVPPDGTTNGERVTETAARPVPLSLEGDEQSGTTSATA